MKRFACQVCGTEVHFDNTYCVSCGSRLGFVPSLFEMSAVEETDEGLRAVAAPDLPVRFCENASHDICNWLVDTGTQDLFCIACRHNTTVPDLSVPDNVGNWRRIELAKRQLFYAILSWGLPHPTVAEDEARGLEFEFLAETEGQGPVLTGHASGTITLNIAEGDDVERERRRAAMGEPYRTLIGHFRHEIGHYYWDRLVADAGCQEAFREIFGDEREDYGQALQRHYDSGPPADWQEAYISSYATSHAWEDFAETWAHYLHIVDALETARAYDIRTAVDVARTETSSIGFDPYAAGSAREVVNAWVPVTVAINNLNRSMGQPDLYPFVLPVAVLDKLQFIHEIVHAARG